MTLWSSLAFSGLFWKQEMLKFIYKKRLRSIRTHIEILNIEIGVLRHGERRGLTARIIPVRQDRRQEQIKRRKVKIRILREKERVVMEKLSYTG